jgi:hypothetical protein
MTQLTVYKHRSKFFLFRFRFEIVTSGLLFDGIIEQTMNAFLGQVHKIFYED